MSLLSWKRVEKVKRLKRKGKKERERLNEYANECFNVLQNKVDITSNEKKEMNKNYDQTCYVMFKSTYHIRWKRKTFLFFNYFSKNRI